MPARLKVHASAATARIAGLSLSHRPSAAKSKCHASRCGRLETEATYGAGILEQGTLKMLLDIGPSERFRRSFNLGKVCR